MKNEVQRFKFDVTILGKVRMSVYAFFVDGMLIDTGHSGAQGQAIARFSKLPIQQIFLSHHHEDHAGNASAIQQQLDCPIYAHPRCANIMKAPPKVCFLERQTWGSNTAVANIIPIENEIKTPHHHFQIIHTPGHSADHVCLYEAQQGWLFSGDLFVHHYIKYFMATESVAEQIRSIQKVLKLDFDRLFCCHNPQETDGKNNLERKLQFFQDFYGNVARLYQKGMPPSKIMKQLGMKEKWGLRILSSGWLSGLNMVNSVIRDIRSANLYYNKI